MGYYISDIWLYITYWAKQSQAGYLLCSCCPVPRVPRVPSSSCAKKSRKSGQRTSIRPAAWAWFNHWWGPGGVHKW